MTLTSVLCSDQQEIEIPDGASDQQGSLPAPQEGAENLGIIVPEFGTASDPNHPTASTAQADADVSAEDNTV